MKNLSKYLPKLNNMSIENYVKETTPQQRKHLMKKGLKQAPDKKRYSYLANFLRLEEQILLSNKNQLAKKIGEVISIDEANIKPLKKDVKDLALRMRSLYSDLKPEDQLEDGYGVPLEGEFHRLERSDVEKVKRRLQDYGVELRKLSKKLFKKELKAFKRSLENRQWIIKKLIPS